MKKEMSEIKRRALLAKQRLKMGYWQRMREEQDRVAEATNDSAVIRSARNARLREFEQQSRRALGDDFAERDERLYGKVRDMLDRDEDVSDPIGRLVDREVFDSLDDGNKQRYILELSAKFRELKERYYKEKSKFV
ncbi:MAG TPA: hypothetical protein H9892_05265 [Candidatus Protoclostridium stercorigallinarum]|uniref:Uncharacterized protein n=1 Tax=Candidatus Protoclostridium stercorigallinarum TaxID=2838741 RepID=A0A9D1Q0N9_9FIRM|nr:hypothetical protein [Candidatus Protoclostridium stercorigallinarum]